MARLIPQGQGGLTEPFELRLGVNRLGRGPHNDFPIDHATVSALHCELVLNGDGLTVRDLGSTNGTIVNGQPVQHSYVLNGSIMRIGSVELLVEMSDAQVVIPEHRPVAAPPILRAPTGHHICLHHQMRPAVWKCTRCAHLLCTPCIHRLRRRGGKALYLCPDCSGICELLPEFARQSRRSWFGFVRDKLSLTRLLPSRRRAKPGR